MVPAFSNRETGMYCASCGAEVDDSARFCCGHRVDVRIQNAEQYPNRVHLARPPFSDAAPDRVHNYLAQAPARRMNMNPDTEAHDQVPNYLAQAILVTIFCCLPFGVVSIVYAAQVNGNLAMGDVRRAREASESAKTWAWIAFWVGLGSTVLSIAALFILGIGMSI